MQHLPYKGKDSIFVLLVKRFLKAYKSGFTIFTIYELPLENIKLYNFY